MAQSYPSRPIKLVIPFPPGGVNDAIGRPWADRMKTLLGTVVIENIGGAGGSLGVAGVARAQPDGYTLVLANTSNRDRRRIFSTYRPSGIRARSSYSQQKGPCLQFKPNAVIQRAACSAEFCRWGCAAAEQRARIGAEA